MGIDFRKNVIILNKTPIHTPRTIELKDLEKIYQKDTPPPSKSSQNDILPLPNSSRNDISPPPLRGGIEGGGDFPSTLNKSQQIMAEILLDFQKALSQNGRIMPIWITGYSEMGPKGLFSPYTKALQEIYKNETVLKEEIYIYRHFSMNQFTIDLKQKAREGIDLKGLGKMYRKCYLAF
jgi:hypothetical protein